MTALISFGVVCALLMCAAFVVCAFWFIGEESQDRADRIHAADEVGGL